MTGDQPVIESVHANLAAVKSKSLRESLDSWGALSCLPSRQTFQKYVMSFLCALHWKYSVFDLAGHLPYSEWSQEWRARVVRLDVDETTAQSSGAIGVRVMKSAIENGMARTGYLGGKQFGKRMVIGHYRVH